MSIPLVLQKLKVGDAVFELFVPEAAAVRQSWEEGRLASPYWCQVWPSALALAGLLVREPHWVEGKSVVELAAGLGLPSVAAAHHAASVLCTDLVPEAVAVAERSAVHNGLHNMRCAVLDWAAPPTLPADVVLLSDVNYDPAAFDALQQLLQHCLQQGMTILLSTPQRLMAKAFIEPLLPFCIRQETETIRHQGEKVFISLLILSN